MAEITESLLEQRLSSLLTAEENPMVTARGIDVLAPVGDLAIRDLIWISLLIMNTENNGRTVAAYLPTYAIEQLKLRYYND